VNVRDIILTDVISAFSVALSTNERKEMRRRQMYGLTYALSGEIVYRQDKRTWISDSRHLLLLPKGQTYSLQCTEGGLFPVVNFDIASEQACPHILVLPITTDSGLSVLFQRLEAQAKSSGAKRLEKLSLLYQVLSQTIRQPGNNGVCRRIDIAALINLILSRQLRPAGNGG
jgi:hypothetical protein